MKASIRISAALRIWTSASEARTDLEPMHVQDRDTEQEAEFRGGIPLLGAVTWVGVFVPMMFGTTLVEVLKGDGIDAVAELSEGFIFWLVILIAGAARAWFAWRTVFMAVVTLDDRAITVVNPTKSMVIEVGDAVVHRTPLALPWNGRTVISQKSSPLPEYIAAAALGVRLPFGRDAEAEFIRRAVDAGATLGDKLSGADWLRWRVRGARTR
ncbi:MAG: hypothetical protein R2733_17590 [Acidimicrobiales bacterium]